MVTKGYHQMHGIDYLETFSPVVNPQTIKAVLTIAISSLDIRQIDVNNTFLNGELDEAMYIDQPLGFVDTSTSHLVCKLTKVLYGLKQARKAWFQKLLSTLIELGFISSKADNSMFLSFTPTRKTILLICVDDIVVTKSDSKYLGKRISLLNNEFARQLNYLLGVEVKRKDASLHFFSTSICDLVKKLVWIVPSN